MVAEEEEIAKQGLADAIYGEAAARNERLAQVELGNALNWIHSLEERHKLRLGKDAQGEYRYSQSATTSLRANLSARWCMPGDGSIIAW